MRNIGIIGLIFAVSISILIICSFFYAIGLISKHTQPVPDTQTFTLTKYGYVIIDGDTTEYKLKKIEVYKMVKEGK